MILMDDLIIHQNNNWNNFLASTPTTSTNTDNNCSNSWTYYAYGRLIGTALM